MPSLIQRDLQHIWHPCGQMKDYAQFPPLEVVKASGSYLELKNGKKIIDAISSWWCKSLGHNHPRLKKALFAQAELFEHVILANTTNEVIVQFAEKLVQLAPSLPKMLFASDGSSVIEMALKMSLQARKLQGETHRTQFIALGNSFHGETIGAMSVSDVGMYRDPYRELLFQSQFLSPLPYVSGTNDPRWQDCAEEWALLEKKLAPWAEQTTAIIVEPILQGAGHMKMYSQDCLRRLRQWSQKHDIHLIADEILTGLGRTGTMFAYQHAGIEPDFLCLGKGLTAGWIPFSVLLTQDRIYDLFYDDYQKGKSFLHSHTFSGNALAASIALEVLNILQEEKMCEKAQQLGVAMEQALLSIAANTGQLTNVRMLGAVVAAEIKCDDPTRRLGFEFYQKALANGAFIRPLGNTLYWLPPLNMDEETLQELQRITEKTLQHLKM